MPEHRTASDGNVLNFILSQVCPNVPRNLPPSVMDAWQGKGGGICRAIYKALIPGPTLSFLAPSAVMVLKVPVNYDILWGIALAHFKRQHHVDITKLAPFYPDTQKGTVETEIVLVNFGGTSDVEAVLAWGRANHYRPINPRECFAIAAVYSKLNEKMTDSNLTIWSLKSCRVEKIELVCWASIDGEATMAVATWMPLGLAPNAWIGFVYDNSWAARSLTSQANKPLPRSIAL